MTKYKKKDIAVHSHWKIEDTLLLHIHSKNKKNAAVYMYKMDILL